MHIQPSNQHMEKQSSAWYTLVVLDLPKMWGLRTIFILLCDSLLG